jgi:O-methyltransferase involved in polyketide biosynthesis
LVQKSKITLTPEQETLLIPLWIKGQPDNPLFFDPKAEEILKQVDYDFERLHIPYKTVILVSQQAKKLDTVTRQFLAENPEGIVLHLGCGLDSRFWRVDNRHAEWYDLDMPPVIALRRRFYPEADHYQLIAASVTDLEWMQQAPAEGNILLHLLTQGREMGQEQLVEQLDVSKPAVSRVLDSLEAKGFVTRQPDPADKRAHRVRLTGKALEIGPDVERAYNQVYTLAMQGISPDELEYFMKLFSRISDNFAHKHVRGDRE